MIEYQDILDIYSQKGYDMYSRSISREEWGNKEMGSKYLEKYWLPRLEYEQCWKPIQDNIFINQEEGFPELVFSDDFDMIIMEGGCLFNEEEFKTLQRSLIKMNEKKIIVVENSFGGKLKEPIFRMKFPVDISWNELTSGNFVSSTFIESIHKEFFVFGDNGVWGKYSANDHHFPIDVIGFKPAFSKLFKENFKQTKEDFNKIQEYLPQSYRDFYHNH